MYNAYRPPKGHMKLCILNQQNFAFQKKKLVKNKELILLENNTGKQ